MKTNNNSDTNGDPKKQFLIGKKIARGLALQATAPEQQGERFGYTADDSDEKQEANIDLNELQAICDDTEFFLDENNVPYACIEETQLRKVLRLESNAFKRLLARRLYRQSKKGAPPSDNSLGANIRLLWCLT